MQTAQAPEQEIIIPVMGVTGTGKSYFIREVSGISDVRVSDSLHSCTAKVEPYSFPYKNTKITLVDTPGFNDSSKSDTQVLTEVCAWMSSNYKKGKLFSGIIYLHRITDVRMDGSSKKYVKMFQRLCGSEAMKNVLLTTTQWSNVNEEQGEKRERELRDGDFWGGLIAEGAHVERFMGTTESGLKLIDKLMRNQPKPLSVQDEMRSGKPMAETNAGKFMNEELASLNRKYQKDLEDLRSELLKAVKEKDDMLREILEEQRAHFRRKKEKVAAEKKYLEEMRAERMKKIEEEMNKREEERRRNDKAVIAVDSNDISVLAHAAALVASYPARGRLIYDINDAREFEKETIGVEIREQPSIFNLIAAPVKMFAQTFSDGISDSNFIIYNNGYYQCKPSRSVKRGSQKFFIFAKF